MNYTTALPDFIEMQRVSFCWFIAQGLTEELNTKLNHKKPIKLKS